MSTLNKRGQYFPMLMKDDFAKVSRWLERMHLKICILIRLKPVFHLANLFARTSKKRM